MPLLWLSLAFLLGILGADLSGSLSREAWGGLLLAGLALGPLLRLGAARARAGSFVWRLGWAARREAVLRLPPLLLLAAFAAGGLRYAWAHQPLGPGDLGFYNNRGRYVLAGWIAEDPDRRDRTTLLRVEVESLRPEDNQEARAAVRGQALAMLAPGGDWRYGQRVLVSGSPIDPPASGDFSYREYLARKGIYTYLTYPQVQAQPGEAGSALLRGLYALRQAGLGVIARLFPAPENALLAGILLGVDSGMPDSLTAAFQATGTAHIIAISGFNMAVLSGLFMSLFGKVLSRWWAALAAVLSLGLYALLVGAGPSVVRAAIMCALAITAAQLGRSAGGVNALLLSAAGMCLFDPNLPWDASFQLTFSATLGLMLYAGPLQGWASRQLARVLPRGWAEGIAGPLGEYGLCTLAAQAATLPIIAWHFGRLSLVSLIANPLALPPQAPLMVLGSLAVAGGLVWEPLGRVFAALAWPLAAYTDRLVEWLAGAPGAQVTLGPGGVTAVYIGCAAVLGAAALRERLRSAWKLLQPAAVMLAVGGLAVLAWRAGWSGADGLLRVTVFDLPGGPAILVRSPEGRSLLAGGAQNASDLEQALGRRLSPVGARLDGLVLSGASGLEGLAGTLGVIPAEQVFGCAGLPSSGAPPGRGLAGARLADALQQGAVPMTQAGPGRALRIGASARLEILARGESGCVLRLELGRLRVLLPGGEAPGKDLVPSGEIVLGAKDDSAWKDKGYRVVSAPPGGWVELSSDGERVWIEGGK